MRIAWWGVLAIGAILTGSGAYTIVASQSAINYINSCRVATACGTSEGNPRPTYFLSGSLSASLQEAELAWIAGVALLALGLGFVIYGVYLHPAINPKSTLQD